MGLIEKIKLWKRKEEEAPATHRRGRIGEEAAKKHLKQTGLKFLAANFTAGRGEIDLVFREDDCLVFVEVKARQEGGWTRPASSVNTRKRRLLTQCAFDYLRLLKDPQVKIRFDIVEVLLEDEVVTQVRHLPNVFTLTAPYRYG